MKAEMTENQPSDKELEARVTAALAEDIGTGDLTAAIIRADTVARARVICREPAILCGRAWFDAVFRQLDAAIRIDWEVNDGDAVGVDAVLCYLHGPARAMLSGERTALNFLQNLSATATETHRYANVVRGTGAQILDTRKTIPCLRSAQKYAVSCGGGKNHRMGLYDMILIKENHILASGSIATAVETARRQNPNVMIEVETETLEEMKQALNAGADIIMLDNFDLASMREAVTLVNHRCNLEASGGVNLDTVRAIAETGVDYISVGALTKDIRSIDLSMRFVLETKTQE